MGFPQSDPLEKPKQSLEVSGKIDELPEIAEEEEWSENVVLSSTGYEQHETTTTQTLQDTTHETTTHDVTVLSVDEWLVYEPSASSSPLPPISSFISPVSPYKVWENLILMIASRVQGTEIRYSPGRNCREGG